MKKRLKYSNITVSGKVCTGVTTLSDLLERELGWSHRSSGQLFREFMKKKGLALEDTTKSGDEIHLQLDGHVEERLKKGKHQIFEGWLTGFVARGIPGVLKILLVCSDEWRIKRFMDREKVGLAEAKEKIKTREAENFKKFSELYKTTDFWDLDKYDLVIDTSRLNKQDMLKSALKKLGHYNDS